jgi:8-oxo-dGTP pyrophosphatase MutT (NUDIX family)
MRDDWRECLALSVTPFEEGVRGLEVQGYRPPGVAPYRPTRTAAVLVPVLDQPDPAILLTLRADHLEHHAGQVSFPGGGADLSDETAVQTALREAKEEIGLEPGAVKPLGFLDRYDIISDYRILPVVGLVKAPQEWVLDEREVAGVFTIPLEVAMDPERYRTHRVVKDGVRHLIYSIEWDGHVVWGATAAMLFNLALRMARVSRGE